MILGSSLNEVRPRPLSAQRLVSVCCVSEMSGEVWVSLSTKEQSQRIAAVSAQRLHHTVVISQK